MQHSHIEKITNISGAFIFALASSLYATLNCWEWAYAWTRLPSPINLPDKMHMQHVLVQVLCVLKLPLLHHRDVYYLSVDFGAF